MMEIGEFQRQIESIYFEKDSARGLDGTFRWFMEEVGELARALREADRARQTEEFADVFAWLSTMASMCGVLPLLVCQGGAYLSRTPRCHSSATLSAALGNLPRLCLPARSRWRYPVSPLPDPWNPPRGTGRGRRRAHVPSGSGDSGSTLNTGMELLPWHLSHEPPH